MPGPKMIPLDDKQIEKLMEEFANNETVTRGIPGEVGKSTNPADKPHQTNEETKE